MDKVLRTFTAGRGKARVGAIVDGSKYRNLGFLRRKGYLIPVPDDTPETPVEEAFITKPAPEAVSEGIADEVPESVSEAVAETESEALAETVVPAPAAGIDLSDPLEAVAAMPVADATAEAVAETVITDPGSAADAGKDDAPKPVAKTTQSPKKGGNK